MSQKVTPLKSFCCLDTDIPLQVPPSAWRFFIEGFGVELGNKNSAWNRNECSKTL
jgi:hypothetical protein